MWPRRASLVEKKLHAMGGFPGPLSPHPTPHPSSADRRAQGWYVPRPHDRARKKGRADWVSHFPQARRTCVVRLLRTSADSSCSAHNNQFVSMFWDLGRPFRLPLLPPFTVTRVGHGCLPISRRSSPLPRLSRCQQAACRRLPRKYISPNRLPNTLCSG